MESSAPPPPPPPSTNDTSPPNYVEAIVKPGDVLYIPPFWAIRSEFSSVSTFIDVLSISQEQLHLSEMLYTQIPILSGVDAQSRIVIGQVSIVF